MVDGRFFSEYRRAVAGLSFIARATPAILFATVVAGCDWYGTRSFSADAITAYVVDADTGEPIAGANVLATWVMKSGLENNTTNYAMVMEAVSDSSGKFTFPAWGPKNVSARGQITDLAPLITIFKSGYRLGGGANRIDKPAPFHMSSEWDGKTFKLNRFEGTADQYTDYLESYLIGDIESLLRNGCHAMSFLQFLRALDVLSKELRTQQVHRRLPDAQSLSDSFANRCGPIAQYIRQVRP